MPAHQVLLLVVFLIAIGFLAAGIVPEVRGGHFDRTYVTGGVILLIVVRVSMRRLRRRDADR